MRRMFSEGQIKQIAQSVGGSKLYKHMLTLTDPYGPGGNVIVISPDSDEYTASTLPAGVANAVCVKLEVTGSYVICTTSLTGTTQFDLFTGATGTTSQLAFNTSWTVVDVVTAL